MQSNREGRNFFDLRILIKELIEENFITKKTKNKNSVFSPFLFLFLSLYLFEKARLINNLYRTTWWLLPSRWHASCGFHYWGRLCGFLWHSTLQTAGLWPVAYFADRSLRFSSIRIPPVASRRRSQAIIWDSDVLTR